MQEYPPTKLTYPSCNSKETWSLTDFCKWRRQFLKWTSPSNFDVLADELNHLCFVGVMDFVTNTMTPDVEESNPFTK